MEVIKFTENEDGTADVELEMTEEEKSLLIQEGFVSLIKKSIELGCFDNQDEQTTRTVPDPTIQDT